jgi:molybdopterin-biosynthesis enzyme MoeA-like protein
MGEFPAGAEIIPNPFNRIPGFSVQEHWFVPGFPQMAWPMIERVLDTRYAHLADVEPQGESSVYVFHAAESQLADLMYEVEARHPGLKVFSLPSMGADGSRRHIELGVRGEPVAVERAMGEMRAEIARRGFPMRETPA